MRMFTSAERIQERGQKTRSPEEFSSMLQVQWQIFIFISGEQLTAIIMKLLQLITYIKTIVFLDYTSLKWSIIYLEIKTFGYRNLNGGRKSGSDFLFRSADILNSQRGLGYLFISLHKSDNTVNSNKNITIFTMFSEMKCDRNQALIDMWTNPLAKVGKIMEVLQNRRLFGLRKDLKKMVCKT